MPMISEMRDKLAALTERVDSLRRSL